VIHQHLLDGLERLGTPKIAGGLNIQFGEIGQQLVEPLPGLRGGLELQLWQQIAAEPTRRRSHSTADSLAHAQRNVTELRAQQRNQQR
jgi:hypothetical protein